MNLNHRMILIMLSVGLFIPTVIAQEDSSGKQHLSFEEALELLHNGNQSLKIADKGVEIAKSEKGKLNAFWYPSVKTTSVTIYRSGKRLCT